ncbi:MAG: WbqC family protein [Bacteroidia bacterium]|nr:WbqC family protein [Bacteroidia bacterium]
MTILLSSAYWPNLQYLFYLLNAEKVYIEQHEHYQKQSFRNRTQILSANGVLDLSIPVIKKAPKEFTRDIEISYAENWQTKHWRAITSAYKNSPYFEYFEDEVKVFYTQRYQKLLDYNLAQITALFKILKLPKEIQLTEEYIKDASSYTDLRERLHPKKDFLSDTFSSELLLKPYYQTFENKFKFHPNLSVLDILFNKGIETTNLLKINSTGF